MDLPVDFKSSFFKAILNIYFFNFQKFIERFVIELFISSITHLKTSILLFRLNLKQLLDLIDTSNNSGTSELRS